MFGLSISDKQISDWIERAVKSSERLTAAVERIRDVYERLEIAQQEQLIVVEESDPKDRS